MNHRHEWVITCDCGAKMKKGEIERRLNALEEAQIKIKHLRIEMEPFIAQIDQRKIAGLYEYD